MDIKSEQHGNTLIIEVSGKLSFKDHPAFNSFMDTISDEVTNLHVNLEKLEQIDSSGIGMLFLAQKVMQQRQGEVKILNPNGQVKRIFDIINLSAQMEITSS